MNITKDNLQSEFQAYERYLKDDEMRSKVQETFELIEFYDEANDCRRAVDAICEMVNRFIAKGKTAEPAKPAASDDKERRLKLLKLKAKAIKMKLELMKLDGIGQPTLFDGMDALDTVAPSRKAQRKMVDDVREHFAKHWDAERGEYVYTDFDGDIWHKNKKGHFCLLNGCDGDGEPRFTFDWEGRVAYIYGFAPDEYEAARDFCAEKVDEKVMRGSGWHFGASGYDARTQSWRFFVLYGAMAAGVNGANSGTRDEYEEYLNEVGESLSEEDFIIGGKDRRPMPYGTALRRYDKTTFNVGYNEWKQENEWRQNHQFNGCDGEDKPYDKQAACDFLTKRFPDMDARDTKIFVRDYWQFKNSYYENLKAFVTYRYHLAIDQRGNYGMPDQPFELAVDYDGGTITPIYEIDDLYGDDYDFAYQWIQEQIADKNLEIDRFWVNENDNTYGYLAK
jgi:hypothetical protein